MELSDENKLIVNGEMFLSLRKYMRENKSRDEIIAKVDELLNQGADINACDSNDNNNTVLHIAALKQDKDIVLYLLQRGAHLFRNKQEKTAIDLALITNTAFGKEVAEIISQQSKPAARITGKNASNQPEESKEKKQIDNIVTTVKDQEVIYLKRSGTSGVSGQFYETKLLSLVLHRALHDQEIANFYLAANIKDIGDFDDVCFRYGNVACYMQTKHRENTDKAKLTVSSVRSSTGKLGLGIYYDSFLKIRQKFSPKANDPMFQGNFEDMDTYFILYTPLKESFDRKLSGNKQMCRKLHDIIHTGVNEIDTKNKNTDIFQFDFEDIDLHILTTFIKYEHMKVLGKVFLEFILSNKKLEVMMANDLIKIYHPALSKSVVSVSKVTATPKTPKVSKNDNPQNTQNIYSNSGESNYIHMGKFRPEFFYAEDHNLMILRNTFYHEIVYTHSSKTTFSKDELKRKIQDMVDNPCPESISMLIGSPIKFDDATDKLYLDVNKLPKNKYKKDEIQQINYDLQKIQVTKSMISQALQLAGQKKLENLEFQLPQSFGNIDLTTNKKNKEDVLDRLNFLTRKFYCLINHFAERNKNKQTKIIDISSDVVGPGNILEYTHLGSNGGIGGAVGNLLEFDAHNESFIFNTKGVLGENASYILEKLKEMTNEDMTKYKIKVTIDGFPRVTFETYKCDKNIAAQFLSKLWFYTNQAQEESVETTLKKEINIHYNADKQRNQFLFHVHSDAIFLRFHDEVQKWWKRQTDASYLTKRTTMFDNAKKGIVDNPLLTVQNVMFIRRIKNMNLCFNVDAIECLNLEERLPSGKNVILNIVSDAVILTATKILQNNEYKDNYYSFINLDYVDILPEEDRKIMVKELKQIKDTTIVIICETPLLQRLRDTLLEILKHLHPLDSSHNRIIIISDEVINIDASNQYNFFTLKDDNVNLLDLTSKSQMLLLEKYDIIYQGREVKLNKLLDDNAKELINAKILWSLLNKDRIEVGHTLDTHKYNEIKNYYINRNLKHRGEEYAVNTLDDIDDKIVLISSKPCMGKTILLTHLSLETKKVDPKPWIVRINLSIHDQDIERLRHNNDINTVMSFLCKAALKKTDQIKEVNFNYIDSEKVSFTCKNAETVSFEFQLFLHCFNSGNIIFLFDGFDKIYPQHTTEGMKLFTALEQANKRMWITSDCYAIKILEHKFGSSYRLERLSTLQQKSFLERFWSTNLRLEKLNHDQFNNLTIFINYIRRTFNYGLLDVTEGVSDRPLIPILSVPLHIIYLTLLEYFKNDNQSISAVYLREKIKKKWGLNSFTSLDRYLRDTDTDESPLSGTPLHMYIAANYFIFQVTDSKFDLNFNSKTIIERSSIYLDAVLLYQQFLNVNIKNICELENKTAIEKNVDEKRNRFLNDHKKLALYAIFQEKDIRKYKILTESEIHDVKDTIKLIESGELTTHLIDSVVDGVPRFYHFLFAEYFIVELLSDLLKGAKNQNFKDVNLNSIWDFIVNIVLSASPASLRQVFEYKLKYDPELTEVASNDNCKKIIFNLLLKPKQAESASTSDADNALNIAINEGLVHVTNLLLKCVQPNLNEDSVGRFTTIIKSSAAILEAADASQTILSKNVLQCVQNLDGDTIMNVLNSNDIGLFMQAVIKEKTVEPVKAIVAKLVELSDNNENLSLLLEHIPNHLPEFIRQLTKK